MSPFPINCIQSTNVFMKYSKFIKTKQSARNMVHFRTSPGNYKYFAFYWNVLVAFGLLSPRNNQATEIRFYLGFFAVQGCFIGLTYSILHRFDQFEIVGYTQTSDYVEYFQLLTSGVTQLLIDLWIFMKRHRFLRTLDDFMKFHKKYRPDKWTVARKYFWLYIHLGVLFIVDSLGTIYLDQFSLRALVGESQYLLQYLVSGIVISFYTILAVTLENILKDINDLIEFQVKMGSNGKNMRKSIGKLLLDRSKIVYEICVDLNDIFGFPFIFIAFFKILEICNNLFFMVSNLADSRLIGIWDYSIVLRGSITRLISPSILFAMSFQGHSIRVQVSCDSTQINVSIFFFILKVIYKII